MYRTNELWLPAKKKTKTSWGIPIEEIGYINISWHICFAFAVRTIPRCRFYPLIVIKGGLNSGESAWRAGQWVHRIHRDMKGALCWRRRERNNVNEEKETQKESCSPFLVHWQSRGSRLYSCAVTFPTIHPTSSCWPRLLNNRFPTNHNTDRRTE